MGGIARKSKGTIWAALVAGMLALSIGSSGCVTYMAHESFVSSTRDQGGAAILSVMAFPFTGACDVALLPLYVLGSPLMLYFLVQPAFPFGNGRMC